MFNTIKKGIHDLLTEPSNNVFCPVRVMAIGGFLYAIGQHAYSVIWQHVQFDLTAFGIGYGSMLATLGAALRWKSDSPPNTQSGAQ